MRLYPSMSRRSRKPGTAQKALVPVASFGGAASRIYDSELSVFAEKYADRIRIVPEIMMRIKRAAFVVVDVSDARPNVYDELGVAQGAGRKVVVPAFKGTELPFDISDVPVIFWEGQKQLRERLARPVGIDRITSRTLRAPAGPELAMA